MPTETDGIATQLCRFAAQIDGEPGERAAEARGWIAPTGEPTAEGLEVHAALEDQEGTRSVFRFVG